MVAKLFVIAGSAGSGHTTMFEAAQAVLNLPRARSATTRGRQPRDRGSDKYIHVTLEEFEQLDSEGALLERAFIHGHHYGTLTESVIELLDAGQDVLLEIDVAGIQQLKQRFGEERVIVIFILPPNFSELAIRMSKRGDDPTDIGVRLLTARGELTDWWVFDELVVNRDVDVAIDEVIALIEQHMRE